MHSEDERGRNQQGWRARDTNEWDDRRYGNQYGGEGTYGAMGGERPGFTFGPHSYPSGSGQGPTAGWGSALGRDPYGGGQPGGQYGPQGNYGQSTLWGHGNQGHGGEHGYGNQGTPGFGYQGNQGFTQGSRGYSDDGRSRRDHEPGMQGWSEPWRGRPDPWQGRSGSEDRPMRVAYAGGATTDAQDWRANEQRWIEPHRGNHVGKGPRGYRRSDPRVQEDVSDALTRDPHVDASEIEVRVEEGEVTLAGTVADRQQKRTAEMCAERVEGVTDVHNQIRVGQERAAADGGAQEEGTTLGRSGKT